MARTLAVQKTLAFDPKLGQPRWAGTLKDPRTALYMSQLPADMQAAADKLGVDTNAARTVTNWLPILARTTFYAGITTPGEQIDAYGPGDTNSDDLFSLAEFAEALAYAMYRTPLIQVKHKLLSVRNPDGSSTASTGEVYIKTITQAEYDKIFGR